MLFSEGMKKERLAQHISQEQLSKISGVPQSTISAVESGTRKPTEETMVMIAKGLRCTVGKLLGEEKKPTAESSELRESVVNLLLDLPEADLEQMRDYASFLKSRHEKE